VHVQRERFNCKFWLQPIALANNSGFSRRELRRVRRIIVQYRLQILEAWREHCGETG
jgi:Domain of unknown function (DUF4160)